MFHPILSILTIVIFLTSCTISFQNICTIGEASDLIDENQTSSPDITADIPIVN